MPKYSSPSWLWPRSWARDRTRSSRVVFPFLLGPSYGSFSSQRANALPSLAAPKPSITTLFATSGGTYGVELPGQHHDTATSSSRVQPYGEEIPRAKLKIPAFSSASSIRDRSWTCLGPWRRRVIDATTAAMYSATMSMALARRCKLHDARRRGPSVYI